MKVALCCIARLENEYIQEWIEHHRTIGVSQFFVYCNAKHGEPRVSDVLGDEKDVTIIPHPGNVQQIPAYNKFIRIDMHKYDFDWVGFIDVDEFVAPVMHRSIPELIRDCGDKSNGTLALQWMMFDSNGHEKKPSMGVREAYTRSYFYPCVKSFWRKDSLKLLPMVYQVHTIGPEVSAIGGFRLGPSHTERPPKERNKCRNESLCETAFIAHYMTKSVEEYKAKCIRGRADSSTPYIISTYKEKWCDVSEAKDDFRVVDFVTGSQCSSDSNSQQAIPKRTNLRSSSPVQAL